MSLDPLSPLPLELKTPPAEALQAAVQNELAARDWAPADDTVMSEYAVVMVANGKTGAQVGEELRDLIGPDDFDSQFVVWLWNAAAALLQGQAPPPVRPSVASAEAAPGTPVAPPPAESAFGYQRSRSRSPGRRSRSPEGSGGGARGGRAAQEKSYRGRPVRPQKELFEAAVNDATAPVSARGRGEGRGMEQDDEMSHILGLDMERADHSAQRAALRGAREKGELFPHIPPSRDLTIRGRANTGKKHDSEFKSNKPSIFARTMTPNPNMPAFVPRQHDAQGHVPMDTVSEVGTSLLSRLGPQAEPSVAPPTAPVLDINTVDVRQFPWEPSKNESCHFGLRCTNPMCAFSHSTPVLANSPKEGDAMMLSTTHCAAGPKCRNTGCTLSHPSPAVSVLATRAQAAARAQMARTRLIAATGPSQSTAGPRSCRFQQACANPQCPFAHFDAQGTPVPPPAQQGPAGTTAATLDSAVSSSDGPEPTIDLDKPLDDTPNAKQCRYGISCTRAGCFFAHPPGRVEPGPGSTWANKSKSSTWYNGNNSTTFNASGVPQARTSVPCKFGAQCFRPNCAFTHPPERQLPPAPGAKPTSDRLAGFAAERDPSDVERIIPTSS